MSRRRSTLPWLLLLAACLTAFWYYRAPRRAWDRFNRALITGGEAELQATVDFPILRDNLKRDLRTAFESRTGQAGETLGGVAGMLIDPIVNATLTPQGIASLISGFGIREAGEAEGGGLIQAGRTSFRYRGPGRVDVHIRPDGDDANAGGIFTFERSGLSWRLVRIWGDGLADAKDPT